MSETVLVTYDEALKRFRLLVMLQIELLDKHRVCGPSDLRRSNLRKLKYEHQVAADAEHATSLALF